MSVATFSIDRDTVLPLMEGSQILVYGLASCNYTDIIFQLLLRGGREIDKVYDCGIGIPSSCALLHKEKHKTLEGREMSLIDFDITCEKSKYTARQCKNGVTQLVLENAKRIAEGLPIITCFYALSKDGEKDPFIPTDMTKREDPYNSRISHEELRRMYKLCHDPKVNPQIREAARKTFVFVNLKRLEKSGAEVYGFEKIAAPWADTKVFEALWKTRMETHKAEPKETQFNWSQQINREWIKYKRAMAVKKEATDEKTKAAVKKGVEV